LSVRPALPRPHSDQLGLAVALFLHARIPGRSAIRALMLMPLMIPPVITALMWKIIVLAVTFRAMDSLRIFDVIYATTAGGPNDATTNLQIMAYQYSFQWYQMGKGMAQAVVLLLLVVMVSYLLMRLWNRASESTQ